MAINPAANQSSQQNLQESLASAARNQVLAVYFCCLAWHTGYYLIRPQADNLRVFPLFFLASLLTGLVVWLLPRQYTLGVLAWLAGWPGLILAYFTIFENPAIVLLVGLLPFLAIVNLGWLAAGISTVLVGWLALGLQTRLGLLALPPDYSLVLFAGSLLLALLGAVISGSFRQITGWSIYNYQKARRDLEEARDERLAFHQLEEDLIHANRELSRMTERLMALNQVAEEAVRVKEEFVANVSHELRTPLNMIIGFCEMITQSPRVYGKKLPDLLLADITAIQRNSQHLSQLVNDVLDLSQIDAGRMALSKQWVTLQEVIREAVEAIRDYYETRQLYLRVHLPEEPIHLLCDRTRIREVILNLLSNAGRFTEQGGIEIRAWMESQKVVVSLSDTGPGISPQDQKRLFEPFQQLDGSIRRKFGGSGLGLYISRQFVEMHGGTMWLESTLGQGATFFFSLPITRPVDMEPPPVQPSARWVNPFAARDARTRRFTAPVPVLNPRFVIYEPGDALQRLMQRYADTLEIDHAEDIGQTVESARAAPAQAVILNLPPHTLQSTDLSSLTAALPYGTPVLSCWIQGSDRAARDLGVVQYLVKPVNREALLTALGGLAEPVHKILLVDDHPEILQLFTRILASDTHKYQVLRAQDGRQALRLLRERKPDVVLLDLVLEEMDGFEVLKEKSADPDLAVRSIPVIVISSLDPTGSPIVSDSLTITHKGGLSALELLNCIQAVSQILSPHTRTPDLAQKPPVGHQPAPAPGV